MEIHDKRIDDYEVSVRTLNCWHSHRPRMVTIGQLAAISDADLLRVPNTGQEALDALK